MTCERRVERNRQGVPVLNWYCDEHDLLDCPLVNAKSPVYRNNNPRCSRPGMRKLRGRKKKAEARYFGHPQVVPTEVIAALVGWRGKALP
jgi:hypothetical protein